LKKIGSLWFEKKFFANDLRFLDSLALGGGGDFYHSASYRN